MNAEVSHERKENVVKSVLNRKITITIKNIKNALMARVKATVPS